MNTTVSLSGIMKLSPLVAGGYTVVLVAGGALVIGALVERRLASRSSTVIAERVSAIIQTLLPVGFIGALIYFVLNNPLI